MSEQIQYISYRELGLDASQRNKVLRNTYWLLALTLVPTVLGAWLGVSTGLGQLFSVGLIFKMWSKGKHYRSPSFQQDMIDNLRNVAIPGTGHSILAQLYVFLKLIVHCRYRHLVNRTSVRKHNT